MNKRLGNFLKTIQNWIVASIGLVGSVVGFVQLLQGNTGLVSIILLAVGIAVLLLSCAYIYFKQVTIGQELDIPIQRPAYSKKSRRIALAGLFLVPILVTLGFGVKQYRLNRPADKIIVLVANFKRLHSEEYYAVTEILIEHLRKVTKKQDDVVIKPLNETISVQEGSDLARIKGREHKASIVVWGWYTKTAKKAPITVHFEILQGLHHLSLQQEQQSVVEELESLEFQDQLSRQISDFLMLAVGIIRYEPKDFSQAENYLKAAIEETNSIPALNFLLHLYQITAMNHLQNEDRETARSFLEKAKRLIDNSSFENLNSRTVTLIGYVYKSLGQVYTDSDPSLSERYWKEAENIFEEILASEPNNSGALNGMGNVLHHQKRFQEALEMHERALKADPNYAYAAHDAAIVCEALMRQDLSKQKMWRVKAIEFWQRAVELGEDNPSLFPPKHLSRIRTRIAYLSGENS